MAARTLEIRGNLENAYADVFQVGGLALGGLTLPQLLRAEGTLALAALLLLGPAPPAAAQQRGHRLPATDLRQRVIWGSSCDGPGGTGLSFGGQDQRADDGRPHTRVRAEAQAMARQQA